MHLSSNRSGVPGLGLSTFSVVFSQDGKSIGTPDPSI